jgi:L-fucose mutarotase
MLKGIPSVISPDLLKILMEMGHGDELVIADGNFPAARVARRLIRADGLGGAAMLAAILQLLPLDQYVPTPVSLMAVVPGDQVTPLIWDEYRAIIIRHVSNWTDFEFLERQVFYERAEVAYAVLATSESAQYANVILKKGVILPDVH